jgi:hypothetical protein
MLIVIVGIIGPDLILTYRNFEDNNLHLSRVYIQLCTYTMNIRADIPFHSKQMLRSATRPRPCR